MTHSMIRIAALGDRERICALLDQIGLNTADALASGTRYWLAEDGGAACGVLGLEYGASAALLRSARVLPAVRGRGLGRMLVGTALAAAKRHGHTRAYLFSTGAGSYWARLGFREVPVDELVAALPDTPQVRQYQRLGWLPTEVAWRRDLNREVV